MKNLTDCHLYGILDMGYVPLRDAVETAHKMLAAGVDIMQLRAKELSPSDILELAQIMVPMAEDEGVPFIINDHPDITALTGADGVHIGQDDGTVKEARELAGLGRYVGKSTHSLEQATAAAAEGADYIGFGPLFATPTKPDYTPIGLDDIAAAHAAVSIPIFCIGGIKRENLREVVTAGARRVVIVSGLLQARDMKRYAADCRSLLGVG